MKLHDLDKPLLPATSFNERDPATIYWIRDGLVHFRGYPIRAADAGTFRFYLGNFAFDKKSCFCTISRLTKANPKAFRALNYAYFKDEKHVWTIFGEVKKADAESFTVADKGAIERHGGLLAFGFGTDRNGVYYIGLYGYMGWLPKVDPGSFTSCGDGHFGFDNNHVYCGKRLIPKAVPATWKMLAGKYSHDRGRVYFLEHLIPDAEIDSLEIIDVPSGAIEEPARDKNHFFLNGKVVDSQVHEEAVARLSRRRLSSPTG